MVTTTMYKHQPSVALSDLTNMSLSEQYEFCLQVAEDTNLNTSVRIKYLERAMLRAKYFYRQRKLADFKYIALRNREFRQVILDNIPDTEVLLFRNLERGLDVKMVTCTKCDLIVPALSCGGLVGGRELCKLCSTESNSSFCEDVMRVVQDINVLVHDIFVVCRRVFLYALSPFKRCA